MERAAWENSFPAIATGAGGQKSGSATGLLKLNYHYFSEAEEERGRRRGRSEEATEQTSVRTKTAPSADRIRTTYDFCFSKTHFYPFPIRRSYVIILEFLHAMAST